LTNYSTGAGGGEADHPMQFILEEDLKLPVAGEIRQGWVVEHQNNVILIDIGAKSEGMIIGREADRMDEESREALAVGNQVHVCVVEPEDQNGNLIVSYSRAAEEQDWLRVSELLKNEETCQGKVTGFNRGGVLARIGELRGFVPNSQLSRDRNIGHQDDAEAYMQELIGQKLHVKVIEVDRERNRLILSERAAEQELREARRNELMAELKEGDVREGRVVNLADFGAFVDIGGIEGLVHLSELSWKRVNNPAEVLKLGDEVKVSILNIDTKRQRLALSIKRLQPDPWTMIEDQYHVGQLVEATITKLTKFGAFARVRDQYELIGLIHISELSEEHVVHPREVVAPSQTVMVRVIRIDPEQRQLGLSLKQVSSDKYLEADLEMLTAS
jgi:small subunit ribosomal protein S1